MVIYTGESREVSSPFDAYITKIEVADKKLNFEKEEKRQNKKILTMTK